MGGVLAVAQPGNLGDEDIAAAPTSTSTTAFTSTTGLAGSTTLAPSATTTTTPAVTTTTVFGEEPTTTIAGSGLGTPGVPSGGDDGTATTGGESMLGLGLAVAAIGFVLRRTAHTRPA